MLLFILQKSLASELQKLIKERTEYCTVDTAYEAVDSTETSNYSELLDCWWESVNTSYDGDFNTHNTTLSIFRKI